MAPGRHERINRRWRALPIGQKLFQTPRGKLFDDVNCGFQHHTLPGERPVRHRVSAVGPQTAMRLEFDDGGVRSFESPRHCVIVVAQTKVIAEFTERLRSAEAVEIRRRSDQYSATISEFAHDGAAIARLGRTVTQLRDDIYLIDVRGRAIDQDRKNLAALRALEIRLPNGNAAPLAQIANFSYGLEEPVVWRRDRLPTITVQADIIPGIQAATVNQQLKTAIDKIRSPMPPGYRLEDGGAVEQSAKGQTSVLAVIPVMFILMLFILMVQLQSVQKLAMVMLTAPLGLIGVTLALLLSHKPFGFVAMLGVFALTGMIIRNSVVLIAQIQTNESAGMDRWNAIVDAAAHRLRPILLTAAAAVLGLIPIAGEVFWGPMAYAMMGGLLVATVLTLFFLPALYAMWYRVPTDSRSTK
jgi:multidrug efflux pump subunit AcrB